ncbi:MAG: hypothetical protein KHY19_03880 [Coprobacillus cateniformis]|jgi:hypothetical protein|nr:hypothetical protein [Coprobacillus cateniformis]
MRELINKVTVTGKVVENNIEEYQNNKGEDVIGGTLVLRTADDSEHNIRFFAYKYKRDENKNFTSEESYFYKAYMDAKDNIKDMKHCSEGENPDIVSITDGMFTDNDFPGKNGDVISTNKIYAKFINKVEPKDYDSTVLEAKFEVEGIIEKIEDEIVKSVPTGNLVVIMDAIGQTANGFGKDAVYTADKLIPIRMIVDKSMATAFRQAGYYEGAYTKLIGTVINSVEIIKQVEKAAFGNDIEKEVKSYIRKNEIKSGTAVSTIFEHELTQEIVDALKAKRKAKLAEVKSGNANAGGSDLPFKPDTSTPAPQTTYNPFAQH